MGEKEISTNIFDYATKELSQDAFICWLASWINHKNENQDLYNVAYNFFKFIFDNNENTKKKNMNISDLQIIENGISRQEKHCDILIKLNNGYYIIIEDKISSKGHNSGKTGENQLKVYKKNIKDQYDIEDENKIITVFYKILDYDKKFEIGEVKIAREDILKEIMDKDIDNDIYMNYKNRLKKLQKSIENIKKIPIKDWQKDYPELIYYLYENEKLFKQINERGERESYISNTGGSIYINWDFREIDLKKRLNVNMDFGRIHLALNINYGSSSIFVKAIEGEYVDENGKIIGKGISNYNRKDRIEIQDNLQKFFEKRLGSCCENHQLRKAKKYFRLLTIDIAKVCNKKSEKLLISDLQHTIKKVTKIFEELIDKYQSL